MLFVVHSPPAIGTKQRIGKQVHFRLRTDSFALGNHLLDQFKIFSRYNRFMRVANDDIILGMTVQAIFYRHAFGRGAALNQIPDIMRIGQNQPDG